MSRNFLIMTFLLFSSFANAGSVTHTKIGTVKWTNFENDKKEDLIVGFTGTSRIYTGDLEFHLRGRFDFLSAFSSIGGFNVKYKFKNYDERTTEEVQKFLEAKLYADDSNVIKDQYVFTMSSKLQNVFCHESGFLFNVRMECQADYEVSILIDQINE